MLSSGTEIGEKYRLSSFIGRGGMGLVWEAEDMLFPERTVALKFLLDEQSATARERFRRESRILSRIAHPGMVQVFDRGVHEDQLYFAMERLHGETLATCLQRGALPLERALSTLSELSDVVAEVHAVDIVHRDLKPSNVFLARYGRRLVIKALDFGIAKAHLFGLDTITSSHDVLGTWQYMAPELLLGKLHDSDARCDVFALGAIFHDCLTGHGPYRNASNAPEVITMLLTTRSLPSIARARPDLPDAVISLIDRMLSFDPAGRPHTAGEVHDAVECIRRAHLHRP